jgi:hypothetical protein
MRASLLHLAATIMSSLPLPIAFAQAPGSSVDPAALVGTWKLTAAYVDTNRNSRLDAAERTAPMQGIQDYLKLNADGSCEFYVHKVAGRYELQPRSDGSRKLVLVDRNNNKEDRGLVHSVSKDELVLLNFSTRLFSVYTRQ